MSLNTGKYGPEKTSHLDTFQVMDYTNGCLLDYPYFKENYKLIAIDLTKQHTFDVDPKAIQYISFAQNLQYAGNTKMFLLLKKSKKPYVMSNLMFSHKEL